MLYYDRIEVSKGIGVNKTSESKKRDICHYWYFLDKRLKSQSDVCNGCHDVLMISVNLNDIKFNDILNIQGTNCRCTISGISKSETLNVKQNIYLTGKRGTL